MMNGRAQEHNRKVALAAQFNQFYLQMTLDTIDQIGSYRIIKEIGEGAFGKVYLARHIILDTQVVLKCGKKDDENIVREIYYHKQLKHRNIVNLYEVIKTELHIWLVLEYCAGGELFYYIYDRKRLAPREAAAVFFQIVLAVRYVHGLGLCHRDLKLENILFADHKRTKIKLSDFGFVREVAPQLWLLTVCGTNVYMAPEMLCQERYSGILVDVWALGVILYTMLYGELPFDDDNDQVIKQKIFSAEPRYLDAVPADINDLIRRMLSKDPKQRPLTAEILALPMLAELNRTTIERDGKVNDAESIISIHQHYKHTKTPFETKLERNILKRLRKINVNTDLLEVGVYKNEMNPLTAFYELLLTQEFSKKKKKYYREKKRRYYEAKKSLRRSSQRVRSVLSLSDQGSIISGGRATSRRCLSEARPELPKLPRQRATPDSIMHTLAENNANHQKPVPVIHREVSFALGIIPPEVQTASSQASANQSNHDDDSIKRRKDKVMHKLQFWKKRAAHSTELLEGDTLKEKPSNPSLDRLTNPSVALFSAKNYADVVEPVPVNPAATQLLETPTETVPLLTLNPADDLRDTSRDNALAALGGLGLEEKDDVPLPLRGQRAPNRLTRLRPLLMASQMLQFSNFSHMSTMTELELDILDELELDDDLFDEALYELSINGSQDFKHALAMTPTLSFTSTNRRKKRPAYPRNPSDSSQKKLTLLSSNSLDDSEPLVPYTLGQSMGQSFQPYLVPQQPRPTLPLPQTKRWKLSMFAAPGDKGRHSPPVNTFNRLNLKLRRHGGLSQPVEAAPVSPIDEKRLWVSPSTKQLYHPLIEEDEE